MIAPAGVIRPIFPSLFSVNQRLRTTIFLGPEQLRSLEVIARKEGVSVAELIRWAIERYRADHRGISALRPRIRGCGAGDDLSRKDERTGKSGDHPGVFQRRLPSGHARWCYRYQCGGRWLGQREPNNTQRSAQRALDKARELIDRVGDPTKRSQDRIRETLESSDMAHQIGHRSFKPQMVRRLDVDQTF